MKNKKYLELLRSALATLRLRRTLKLLKLLKLLELLNHPTSLPQVSPRGDLEGALFTMNLLSLPRREEGLLRSP